MRAGHRGASQGGRTRALRASRCNSDDYCGMAGTAPIATRARTTPSCRLDSRVDSCRYSIERSTGKSARRLADPSTFNSMLPGSGWRAPRGASCCSQDAPTTRRPFRRGHAAAAFARPPCRAARSGLQSRCGCLHDLSRWESGRRSRVGRPGCEVPFGFEAQRLPSFPTRRLKIQFYVSISS